MSSAPKVAKGNSWTFILNPMTSEIVAISKIPEIQVRITVRVRVGERVRIR